MLTPKVFRKEMSGREKSGREKRGREKRREKDMETGRRGELIIM